MPSIDWQVAAAIATGSRTWQSTVLPHVCGRIAPRLVFGRLVLVEDLLVFSLESFIDRFHVLYGDSHSIDFAGELVVALRNRVAAQLASLPVQVNAVVAEPVADWSAKYSIMLRYVTARMTRAVVVIDAIFGRFVDLIDGVEVVYFRHGTWSL